MTVQPAAARWTVSSRLGFIPNTHWQLGRTIDVPLGGTISRYASTGFYSGILHVLASALVTYFTAINCDFKQHFRTGLHVTLSYAFYISTSKGKYQENTVRFSVHVQLVPVRVVATARRDPSHSHSSDLLSSNRAGPCRWA